MKLFAANRIVGHENSWVPSVKSMNLAPIFIAGISRSACRKGLNFIAGCDQPTHARGGFIDVYSIEVTLTSIPGGRVDRVIS